MSFLFSALKLAVKPTTTARSFSSLSGFSALRSFQQANKASLLQLASNTAVSESTTSYFGLASGSFAPAFTSRRWKSRGNTFQPSTLKRKRKFGFLSRMKSRDGRKIISKRKNKGRWYLAH